MMTRGYRWIIVGIGIFYYFSLSPLKAQNFNLTPPETEKVEEKKEHPIAPVSITQYKYTSRSSKEKILEFYRLMFANAGFKEVTPIPYKERPAKDRFVFFFAKPNIRIMLNFLYFSSPGYNSYYLTIYSIDKKTLEKRRKKKKK